MADSTTVSNSGNLATSQAAFDTTAGAPHSEGLTPDALLVYLSTRLGSLEDQINDYFAKEQRADRLRGLLIHVKHIVQSLDVADADPNSPMQIPQNAVDDLTETFDEIRDIDPKLASTLLNDLQNEGFVGSGGDLVYRVSEVEPSVDYLDDAIDDLNSASQLDMIHLQSLVRAYETAVSLGTNMVETAGRTAQKIADRIGG